MNSEEKGCAVAVILVIIFIIFMLLLPKLLTNDQGIYLVIDKATGRVIILEGPPRGHPDHSNIGLPGQWTEGYYYWKHKGEVVQRLKAECEVHVIPD